MIPPTTKGSAALHLLVLLKFLGSNGNEASISKLGHFFGLSKGGFLLHLERMVVILLKRKEEALFWPGPDEWKEISERIERKYGFPNCVGLIDGTLLPLEGKPNQNGEDYFCRKGCYSVNALITCDDAARVRDVVIGWPGSVHDNQVWTTSHLYANQMALFRKKEYLLGDSAFQPSNVMIPAFKKPCGAAVLQSNEFFNTQLAKPWVISHYCIGILKGRFQYLKWMCVHISKSEDMSKIIDYFNCACILHNWLIDDPIPPQWIEPPLDEDDAWDDRVVPNEHDQACLF